MRAKAKTIIKIAGKVLGIGAVAAVSYFIGKSNGYDECRAFYKRYESGCADWSDKWEDEE